MNTNKKIYFFFIILLFVSCEAQIKVVYTTVNDKPVSEVKTQFLDGYKKKIYHDSELKTEVEYINSKKRVIIYGIIYYLSKNENKAEVIKKLSEEYRNCSAFNFVIVKKEKNVTIKYINSNIHDDEFGLEYDEIRAYNNENQLIYKETIEVDYWKDNKPVIKHNQIYKFKYDKTSKNIVLSARYPFDKEDTAYFEVNEFDEKGKLIDKYSKIFYEENYFNIKDFDKMKAKFFPNEDIEYYRNKKIF